MTASRRSFLRGMLAAPVAAPAVAKAMAESAPVWEPDAIPAARSYPLGMMVSISCVDTFQTQMMRVVIDNTEHKPIALAAGPSSLDDDYDDSDSDYDVHYDRWDDDE